jgi:hypothetical protein
LFRICSDVGFVASGTALTVFVRAVWTPALLLDAGAVGRFVLGGTTERTTDKDETHHGGIKSSHSYRTFLY